jgi:hypothetical protein
MKSKHSIKSINSSVITLDNGSQWKIGITDSVLLWSTIDRVELDDQGMFSTIHNINKNKTVKVTRLA